jgi:hypothetical protein
MLCAARHCLRRCTRSRLPILILLSMGYSAGQDTPALGGSIRQLRFSPDGRYALAQDDAVVTVLTLEPFAILFQIPTHYATDAQFTPDSRSVVFASSVSRVDSRKIVLASPTLCWSSGASLIAPASD